MASSDNAAGAREPSLASETEKSEEDKLKRYESTSKDGDEFMPVELNSGRPVNRDIEFADDPQPRAKKTGIKLDRRTTTIRSIILGDDEDNEVNLRLRRGTSRVPMEYRTMSIQVLDTLYHIQRRPDTKNAETDSEFFARVDYHTVPVNVIYQRFNVSPQVGLDAAGVTKRLERHGKNILAQVRTNYFKKIALYFFGGFSSILWVGVIVNFICWKPLGEPAPQPYYIAVAVAILLVILLNAAFTAYQDFSTGNIMKAILNLIPENVTVLRDGTQVTIPAEGLVPGDIVYLTTGTKVGADMRIIQASSDLRFDRAVLTGESEEVSGVVDSEEVNFLEAKNIAFLGSHVCNGTATAVVVLTGGSSVMGRINKLTNSGKDKETLIQKEINRFIRIIICLTITLIAIMVIYWGAYLKKVHPDFLNVSGILSDLMGLVVAFIPEGMPVAVAMTLSIVAKRMKAADVLPKSLGTVETLGCVNMFCSDKTGTLTQNKMTVESVGFVDGQMTAVEAHTQYTKGTTQMNEMSALQRLVHTGTICNDAFFEDAGVGGIETKDRPVNGNATDAAVLRFVHGASPVDSTRSSNPRVVAIPFNSRNKWMLTVVSAGDPEKGGAYDIMLKGAPDILLSYCTHAVSSKSDAGPAIIPLDEAARRDVVHLQETWARRGERVIVMAYKRVEMSREEFEASSQEEQLIKLALSDLTLIGLVGIMDPPKLAIPSTVKELRRSGSRFSVVTGDFKLTAAAIARKCGILTCSGDPYEVSNMEKASELTENGWLSGGLVLQGSEIDKLDDTAWETVCKFEEIVFARTSPEQKLRIVKQFQQRKQIVAVTGDGVNDAAALKAANVGIAMLAGSDVAIEAADLVLLGDFSSIVEGVRLGRLVFQNLQKVVSYLLPAGSYSEDWPVILNVFAGVPLPLSSFLMIIICCFTDLFCCLTLIVETEEDDLLSLPPRNAFTDHLVNFKLYGQAYLFLGTIETVCAHAMFFLYMYQATGIPLGGLFLAYENYGSDGYYGVSADDQSNALVVGQSVYFVTLVVMQWFNLLTTRNKRLSILQSNPITRAKNGRRNLYVPLGIAVAFGIAVFITEVPPIQRIFLTGAVPIRFWLIPLGLGAGMLILDDVRKLLVRTFPKSIIARVAF